MKLKLKLESFDDELMLKRFKLKVGDKKVTTPVKSGYKKCPVGKINEIYRKFSLDKINKCLRDERVERTVNSEIGSDSTSDINFCIVDYCDLNIPNYKQIETLSDIQYGHSDILVTPTFSKLIRELNVDRLKETFIDLTNQYISCVQSLNDKSIIGVIPSRMPRL